MPTSAARVTLQSARFVDERAQGAHPLTLLERARGRQNTGPALIRVRWSSKPDDGAVIAVHARQVDGLRFQLLGGPGPLPTSPPRRHPCWKGRPRWRAPSITGVPILLCRCCDAACASLSALTASAVDLADLAAAAAPSVVSRAPQRGCSCSLRRRHSSVTAPAQALRTGRHDCRMPRTRLGGLHSSECTCGPQHVRQRIAAAARGRQDAPRVSCLPARCPSRCQMSAP